MRCAGSSPSGAPLLSCAHTWHTRPSLRAHTLPTALPLCAQADALRVEGASQQERVARLEAVLKEAQKFISEHTAGGSSSGKAGTQADALRAAEVEAQLEQQGARIAGGPPRAVSSVQTRLQGGAQAAGAAGEEGRAPQVPCIAHSCTLHPAGLLHSCTLHPAPCTLHPAPCRPLLPAIRHPPLCCQPAL